MTDPAPEAHYMRGAHAPIRSAAPSEPPAEHGPACPICNGQHFREAHDQPPAKAQQDDELLDRLERARRAANNIASIHPSPLVDNLRRYLADAQVIAARPSADTETLRRVRELAAGSSVDGGGLYVNGWNAAMTEVRAALDGDS